MSAILSTVRRSCFDHTFATLKFATCCRRTSVRPGRHWRSRNWDWKAPPIERGTPTGEGNSFSRRRRCHCIGINEQPFYESKEIRYLRWTAMCLRLTRIRFVGEIIVYLPAINWHWHLSQPLFNRCSNFGVKAPSEQTADPIRGVIEEIASDFNGIAGSNFQIHRANCSRSNSILGPINLSRGIITPLTIVIRAPTLRACCNNAGHGIELSIRGLLISLRTLPPPHCMYFIEKDK